MVDTASPDTVLGSALRPSQLDSALRSLKAFYLVGYGKFASSLQRQGVQPIDFDEKASALLENDQAWLAIDPAVAAPASQRQYDAARHGHPLSFAKAVHILVACQLAANEVKADYSDIVILPAVYVLRDFGLERLDAARRRNSSFLAELATASGQSQDAILQIIRGAPVTLPTADGLQRAWNELRPHDLLGPPEFTRRRKFRPAADETLIDPNSPWPNK